MLVATDLFEVCSTHKDNSVMINMPLKTLCSNHEQLKQEAFWRLLIKLQKLIETSAN